MINRLDGQYHILPNIVFTKGLSAKAIGVYAYCMSRPNSWEFSIKGIAAQLKDGKDSIRTAVIELEEAGLLIRVNGRGNGGLFSSEWILNPTDKDIEDARSTVAEKPTSEKPTSEKPPQSINKEPITEETNKTPLPPTVTSTEGKPQHSRRLDRDWNVLIQVLRDRARLKSKIKDTDEAYQAYLQVEDRSMLVNDYIDHLQAKGDYAKNLTNFLLDYKPKNIEDQIEDGEVVIWA